MGYVPVTEPLVDGLNPKINSQLALAARLVPQLEATTVNSELPLSGPRVMVTVDDVPLINCTP